MSIETVVAVKWKPAKFKELKGSQSRQEAAENIGVSPVFLDKLLAGDRKLSINALAKLCVRTNTTPNEFFEIVVKK